MKLQAPLKSLAFALLSACMLSACGHADDAANAGGQPTAGVLVAHWSFDDPAHPLLNSVDKREARSDGNPVCEAGKVGKSLRLRGAPDNLIESDPAGALEPEGAFALDLWFKAETVAVQQRLAGKWGATLAGASYILWINDEAKPEFLLANGEQLIRLAAPDAIEPNRWYHLRGEWDGADKARLLLDDAVVSEKTGVTAVNKNRLPFYVSGGAANTPYFFSGWIDEVRFFRAGGKSTHAANTEPQSTTANPRATAPLLRVTTPNTTPAKMALAGGEAIAPGDARLDFSDGAAPSAAADAVGFGRPIKVDNEYAAFAFDSAGARIRFATDAPKMQVRLFYRLRHAWLGSGDGIGLVLADEAQIATFGENQKQAGELLLDIAAPLPPSPASKKSRHVYEVVLPYGQDVEFRGLTLAAGSKLLPVPPRPKVRWVAYGDSITQGYFSSHIGHSYPFLVAQQKGWQAVNMGFAGYTAHARDGESLAALKGDVYTVAMGFNDYRHKPLADYRADLQGVLSGIRAGQPQVPVYFIAPLWSSEPPQYASKIGLHLEDYRNVVREVVKAANAAKDRNVHLVEGLDLIPHEAKYFPDGIHPNDAGFDLMAKALAPHLTVP